MNRTEKNKEGRKKAMQYFKIFFILTGTLLFIMTGSFAGFAQDTPGSTQEIEQLKNSVKILMDRVKELERQVQIKSAAKSNGAEVNHQVIKEQVQTVREIKEALGHLEFSGGVTTVLQGTSGNDDNPPNYGDSTDGAFTVDLNIATHFGRYGNFFVHLEGGEGEGLNDDVASFSIPNYDSYATRNRNNQSDITISEAFYEITPFDNKMAFDVGKMDISVLFDENEAAGDETSQFLSNIFVKSMGLTIPEPDNFYCPAVMVKLAPVDLVEFRVIGASVEDDNWEDVFDHGFLATQIAFKPKLFGKPGNYRIYGWWDGRRHLENQDLAVANGRAIPVYNDSLAEETQKGWGISLDQQIVEGVTGFVRYSQTNDDLSRWNGAEWEIIPFNRLWTLGVQLSGEIWQRERDTFGVAFGKTVLTDDYRKANVHTGDESYLESYYRLGVTDRLAISGDLQWVKNAGGNSLANDVYIFGLRGQLGF
jgi:carbohydrate-selective porin OprB